MPQLYHLLKMISQGDVALARQELTAILQAEPGNTEAWSLMALAVAEPDQKAYCYRQVLKFDPANENARLQLTRLETQLASPAVPATPEAAPFASPPVSLPPSPPAGPPVAASSQAAAAAFAAPGVHGLIPPDPAPSLTPSWLTQPAAAPAPAATPAKRRDYPNEAFDHISNGRPQKALQVIEEGLVVHPKDPALWKLYVETGDAEYVKKQARRFLELDPSNIVAQQALDRLKSTPKSNVPVRKDSCSEQVVYLIAGLGIIGILQLVMVILSAVTGANIFGELADTPQNALGIAGVCLNGILALFSLGLWIYLGVVGWDYELNDIIKGAIVFVAILTPLGWYWVGRGAVRLTRTWLSGGENTAKPVKESPPV